MIAFGLTDHLEGTADAPSRDVYARVAEQTRLADELGFEYAWFAEHHAHAHFGHLPAPLLFALHLAGQTKQIRLGTAIICLNLHHPLAVAEQAAVADLISGGRMAVGFGSGSTPEEFSLFGLDMTQETERHARFAAALRLIRAAWHGEIQEEGGAFGIPSAKILPIAAPDLTSRSWLAVNSVGAAKIAGALGFNMLFSHLRTPAQYREYRAAYHEAGGRGIVAANRPIHVARDDRAAFTRIEPALRALWRRFRSEGKIPGNASEPEDVEELCGHPINFIVGGPERVARQLAELHRETPYDVANVEVRWAGLAEDAIHDCMRRIAAAVRPLLNANLPTLRSPST